MKVVKLIEITKDTVFDLNSIVVDDMQTAFSGHGKDYIPYVNHPNKTVIGIYDEQSIVGCFYLDFAESCLDDFFSHKDFCVLKGLSISQSYQGQGYAKAAILKLFK